MCSRITLLRRFPVPLRRLDKVFCYTLSILIAIAESTLRPYPPLLCGFPVPLRCLGKVFCYAFSIFIAVAKITLRLCKPLLCRSLVPFSGLSRVFHYTFSIRIANAQIVLRSCIALFCRLAVAFKCLLQVFCDTCAMSIAVTQFFLCLRIALHCRLAVQFCGLCLVLADAVTGLIAHTQLILCFRAFLLCRFGVPLHSRHIVRECRIQPSGHILGRHISLSRRRFVPSAGLFVVLFNAPSLIIALAQCALCLGIALLCGLFVPHDRIFFVFFHTRAVLIAPGHFKLCLGASVISGRDHVLLERHFGIAGLLIALAQCALCLGIALLCGLFVPHDRIFFVFFHTHAVLIAPCHLKLCLGVSVISGRYHILLERHFGIAGLLILLSFLQVVLHSLLFCFLLCFLAQAEALHASHKLLLFILRAVEQETVRGILLSVEIHLLDFSPQTAPLHAARSRFKPLLDGLCLHGFRDFHRLSAHADRLQLVRKTHFHLNFAHILSLLMVL